MSNRTSVSRTDHHYPKRAKRTTAPAQNSSRILITSLTTLHTSVNPATSTVRGPASTEHSPLAPEDGLVQESSGRRRARSTLQSYPALRPDRSPWSTRRSSSNMPGVRISVHVRDTDPDRSDAEPPPAPAPQQRDG